MTTVDLKESLLVALALSDERARNQRADRIIWMGQFERGVAFAAYADTATVLSETKSCFIDGHFVATQILTLSFAEHVLFELLTAKDLYRARMSLEAMIRVAIQNQLMPLDLLTEMDRLRELRNPFVHREAGQRTLGLGERVQQLNKHPHTLLEQDAKDSISLLFKTFNVWLSRA